MGNESSKPLGGREFIIVTVQIKNVGKGKVEYCYYDFCLINRKGQIFEQDAATLNRC
jgi:hypothetical protein